MSRPLPTVPVRIPVDVAEQYAERTYSVEHHDQLGDLCAEALAAAKACVACKGDRTAKVRREGAPGGFDVIDCHRCSGTGYEP